MKDKTDLKQALFNACEQHIEQRIQSIEQRLQAIAESRNDETKSSVGDKYETGRAMMQMEEEKSRGQLSEAIAVKQELLKIDIRKHSETIDLGSLVKTNKGDYFFSIGIGKVKIGDGLYYCISSGSPIGQKMKNKRNGDAIEFNNSVIKIEEIY